MDGEYEKVTGANDQNTLYTTYMQPYYYLSLVYSHKNLKEDPLKYTGQLGWGMQEGILCQTD